MPAEEHSIPPFYGCYLLRSYSDKPRRGGVYIGVTPDPKRRKRQHNGDLVGGAFRTRWGRPWEMDLIVYNFPSKIATLHFEYAWTYPTKARSLRLSAAEAARFPNAEPGDFLIPSIQSRARGKHGAAADGRSKMIILRALLASEPFSHWGLRVVIFAEWAWHAWAEAESFNSNEGVEHVSRGGSPFPMRTLIPGAVCSWSGVDGSRSHMLEHLPPPNDTPVPPRRRPVGTADPTWPEAQAIPKLVTTMVGTNFRPGKGKELTLSEQQDLANELSQAPIYARACSDCLGPTDTASFPFHDDWVSEAQWVRFSAFLQEHHLSYPFEDPDPIASCALCPLPVHLKDPLSYSLCAAPYLCVEARSPTRKSPGNETDVYCNEVYHITCLADAYAPGGQEPLVLPLSGQCPGCIKRLGSDTPHGSWAYVVRAVFRRKDVMERLAPGMAPERRRRSPTKGIRTTTEPDACSESEDSFHAPAPVKGFYVHPPVGLDTAPRTAHIPPKADSPPPQPPDTPMQEPPPHRPAPLSTGSLLAALDLIEAPNNLAPGTSAPRKPNCPPRLSRPRAGPEQHHPKPNRRAWQPATTQILSDSSEDDPWCSDLQQEPCHRLARVARPVVDLAWSDGD